MLNNNLNDLESLLLQGEENRKEKWREYYRKYRESMSDEQKEKVRKSMREYYTSRTEEQKEKQRKLYF